MPDATPTAPLSAEELDDIERRLEDLRLNGNTRRDVEVGCSMALRHIPYLISMARDALALRSAAEAWYAGREHEKRCTVAYQNTELGDEERMITSARIAWQEACDAADQAAEALAEAVTAGRATAGTT